MTLQYPEALEQVKAQVAASRTSFGAGMAILPKERREGMYALYAFCRVVDDIADESPSPEIAAKGLQEWRVRIADAFRGTATDAITTTLLPAIAKFGLIEKDFQEIIDGMEMDSIALVAPDYPTLDRYCDLVASAVGRASVRLFGAPGPEGQRVAYHLGRALQLTNILRDLSEDAQRGRLYLPRDFLEKHGIATRVPTEVLAHANLSAVCRDLAQKAESHYAEASAAMKKCPASAMRPARIMRNYYRAIFNRLVAEDWRDISRRVSLSKAHKIVLVLKGMILP
jgi:phytoene synthase